MSLYKYISKENKNKNPLPELTKEMPICACLKGSYTLEATVIIPIVVGFWMCLMLFFRVLQVQTAINQALDYAGRNVAVLSSTMDSESALLVSAEGLFLKEIKEYDAVDKYVKGGKLGISLLKSDFSENMVVLEAEYKIKLPVNFFNIKKLTFGQTSCHMKWLGKQVGESDDTYVYYTETGTVYHLTKTCSYLDLSIHSANMAEIKALRNKNNHKYSACSCYVAKNTENKTVYITDYGTKYHGSLSCSSLKRTIYTVKLSEVSGRRLCSKCKLKSKEK